MTKCFEDSVKILEGDSQPETYRNELELLVLKAFWDLNYQWQGV